MTISLFKKVQLLIGLNDALDAGIINYHTYSMLNYLYLNELYTNTGSITIINSYNSKDFTHE